MQATLERYHREEGLCTVNLECADIRAKLLRPTDFATIKSRRNEPTRKTQFSDSMLSQRTRGNQASLKSAIVRFMISRRTSPRKARSNDLRKSGGRRHIRDISLRHGSGSFETHFVISLHVCLQRLSNVTVERFPRPNLLPVSAMQMKTYVRGD